jgi:hypothetical protein
MQLVYGRDAAGCLKWIFAVIQLVFCTLRQGRSPPVAIIERIPQAMTERHLQLSSIRLHSRKRDFLRIN